MGPDAATSASRSLRLLSHPDLRHPPVNTPAERRTGSSTPGAPLNIGLLDYFTKTVDEVAACTPGASSPPAEPADLYEWCIEHTGDADEAQRLHRDTVFEKHRLEHAIRLGEYDEICKEPCPKCGCWGLMWDPAGKRAMCSNRRCRTPDGLTSRWTCAQLATQKIRRTEVWRRNAT